MDTNKDMILITSFFIFQSQVVSVDTSKDQQDGSHIDSDPTLPLKILFISIAVTFTLVLCLQPSTRSEQGDDGHTADLGNPTGVAHGYERYHVGSGPSYESAPVSQALPERGMGYGATAGAGYHPQATYAGPTVHAAVPLRPGGQGQQLGHRHPQGHPLGYDSPGSRADQSPRCHQHDDINHEGGRQNSREEVGFRPGTGTHYPSRPPPDMDVAIEGGSTSWPVVSQGYGIVVNPPYNRDQLLPSAPPVSVSPTMQNDDNNGVEPPSYDVAVSNMRF